MAKSYQPIGTDCAVVVERAGEGWHEDVRVKAGFAEVVEGITAHVSPSRVLRTDEIGHLASYLALIYHMRTGKHLDYMNVGSAPEPEIDEDELALM